MFKEAGFLLDRYCQVNERLYLEGASRGPHVMCILRRVGGVTPGQVLPSCNLKVRCLVLDSGAQRVCIPGSWALCYSCLSHSIYM